ncbi:MAG: phosphatase PAP2 family protein [Bacteroidia bacterium]
MIKNIFIFIFSFSLCFSCIAQNADIDLLNKINGPGTPAADKTFKFISNSVGPVSIAAPLSMFVTGLATKDKVLQRKSYVAAASLFTSTVITVALKVTVKRPRPFETYPDIIIKKDKGGSYSFPSGHTSSAFATATSLSLAFPKWYVIAPSFLYAGAVGYSRMYLGVHYPSDVFGGIVIGVGSSFLMYKADQWINKK